MLPLCNSRAMLMPINVGMPRMAPVMMPVQPAPMLCPQSNIDMCLPTTSTDRYDSRMYGRFRHVGRDYPHYRHAPFDWYQPPKQRHNVIHEDAAVVTLDGPIPIGDYYRHYIYGEDTDDDYYDDESTSYTSEEYDDIEEPSYEQRTNGYRRSSRVESSLDNIGRRNPTAPLSNRQSRRTSNYPTLDPYRRNPIPSNSNRSTAQDNDSDDASSINSTYAN